MGLSFSVPPPPTPTPISASLPPSFHGADPSFYQFKLPAIHHCWMLTLESTTASTVNIFAVRIKILLSFNLFFFSYLFFFFFSVGIRCKESDDSLSKWLTDPPHSLSDNWLCFVLRWPLCFWWDVKVQEQTDSSFALMSLRCSSYSSSYSSLSLTWLTEQRDSRGNRPAMSSYATSLCCPFKLVVN